MATNKEDTINKDTDMTNVEILQKVLELLEGYSFDQDVTRFENTLIKRLLAEVEIIAEDYVECFKDH